MPGTDLYNTVREQGHININSLEEWAEYGQENHYEYNKWSNPPWFTKRETQIYLDGYMRFMEEHGDIVAGVPLDYSAASYDRGWNL